MISSFRALENENSSLTPQSIEYILRKISDLTPFQTLWLIGDLCFVLKINEISTFIRNTRISYHINYYMKIDIFNILDITDQYSNTMILLQRIGSTTFKWLNSDYRSSLICHSFNPYLFMNYILFLHITNKLDYLYYKYAFSLYNGIIV